MFGFGGSQPDSTEVFAIDDIRELVLSFPYKTSLDDNTNSHDSDPNELIPLASGNGFSSKVTTARNFAKLLDGKYGRIPVSAISEHLDITSPVLLRLVHEDEGAILSRNSDSIVTVCEQRRLLEELRSMTATGFVPAESFALKHDIDSKDIAKLIHMSEESSVPPLQLLEAPQGQSVAADGSDYPYIHTLTLLLDLRRMIREKLKTSHDESKPACWSTPDMLGLNSNVFWRLAQGLATEPDQEETIQGYFESTGKDEVRFVPRSYLLRKAKRRIKDVAQGIEPFCDLQKLVQKYPTVLLDVEAAKEFVEKQYHHTDGAPYTFHFVSHYAIGDISLNNTARACHETLGLQRYVSTKPYLHSFPEEIQADVQNILQERTILLFRRCGGCIKDVKCLKEYIILCALIEDLEFAAKRLSKSMVDQQWKAQPELSVPRICLDSAVFLQTLQEESDIPKELLERLWANDKEGIHPAASSSFNRHLAEIQAESHLQFASFWRSRVLLKAELYSSGLAVVEAGSLRDQLGELLSSYLAQDLMLGNIKRARSKGFVRTQQVAKQVDKLQAALAEQKKDKPLDSLAKFNKKMGIEQPEGPELATAKQQHIEEMVQAVKKDSDAPRLFLSTVIVLFASKHKGVVHATGKFAPRLLKLLKSDLNAEQFTRLEKIKDAVKAGTVDDGMREEMRAFAAAALAPSQSSDEVPQET